MENSMTTQWRPGMIATGATPMIISQPDTSISNGALNEIATDLLAALVAIVNINDKQGSSIPVNIIEAARAAIKKAG
jgi:hypothetical protein